MKLLLIEDNPSCRPVSGAAWNAGMTVAVCADGLQALPAWRAQVPDLVLLDLSLPGLDGLQVLGQARAAGLRTPVIILTARGTVGDKILGLNQGADDYLPKPFDLDELEARSGAGAPPARERQHLGDTRSDVAVQACLCGLRVDPDSGAVDFRARHWNCPARAGATAGAAVQTLATRSPRKDCSSRCFQAKARCNTTRSRSWSTACAGRSPRYRCRS